MRSPRAGLPRVRVVPRSVESDADDAIRLAGSYGLTPFGWQEDVLDSWMGRRADGRWAAATCGLAVPRQNGKNAVIEVREFYGAAILGERIIHTAHQVKTAREAFIRVAGFFEDERHPEIAALVKEVRRANGQEAVTLHNGGQIRFIARSGPSGRGMTADVLILDEAQDLNDDELAALLPMISASPLGNPQVILTGTPPDPDRPGHGAVFRRIRADGESKRDARLAWSDFGAADGPLPDVDDVELVVRCNPSMAEGLISPDEAKRERGLMSPETFARERLGWWGDPAETGVSDFPVDEWRERTDTDKANSPSKMAAFAIEVDLDRAWASIGTAGRRSDGKMQVELVDRRRGMTWLVDRCRELDARHGPTTFVIDGAGAAGTLEKPLTDAGLKVVVFGSADVAKACAAIIDAVVEDRVAHGPDETLDAAVAGCRRKTFRDGGFTFSRLRSENDVTPLVAITHAHWAALTNDGPPGVWSMTEIVAQLRAERAAAADGGQGAAPASPTTPAAPDTGVRPDGSRFHTF